MDQTIIVRHKVKDFDTWLEGHSDRETLFAPAVSSFRTFQDSDDPNSVVMILEVKDMDKLVAMMNDPETQVFKDKHTVLDPIILSMPVEVRSTLGAS